MSDPIHIVTIGGSVRPGNMTGRALALVHAELAGRAGVTLDAIDPAELALGLPGATPPEGDAAPAMRDRVAKADGVILASPEYHGSYSSVIKLVIDNLGYPSMLAGKPIALLGVAAGAIGAIKALEHLRSVASHIGAIVLPGPVSVANVHAVFDEEGRCADEQTAARIRGTATKLLGYIESTSCPEECLEDTVRAD